MNLTGVIAETSFSRWRPGFSCKKSLFRIYGKQVILAQIFLRIFQFYLSNHYSLMIHIDPSHPLKCATGQTCPYAITTFVLIWGFTPWSNSKECTEINSHVFREYIPKTSNGYKWRKPSDKILLWQ